MEVPAEDIVGHYEEEFKPLMQDNFIQETDKEVEESETPQSYIKHFVNPKGREYILSFHKTLVSYNKGKRGGLSVLHWTSPNCWQPKRKQKKPTA